MNIKQNLSLCLLMIICTFTSSLFLHPAFTVTKYEQNFLDSFPSTILDWEKGDTTDFEKESPGGGVSINYRKTGVHAIADLYIYDNNLTKIPSGTDSKIIKDAFSACIDSKYYLLKKGIYQKLDEYETGIRRVGTTNRSNMLFSKFILTSNDTDKIDVIYFTAINNHFFKILLTYKNEALSENELKAFLDNIWDLIYSM